ncbi:MAG: DUF4468 domain-containing protein [Bacteroides sp.]|nr:DUF4468 domain-containing protein [Bacteroides sp.]
MKKLSHLLIVLLACMPVLAFGQEDSKYLAGAVPEVDGKIVFSREFDLTGASQEAIYERMHQFLTQRMNENENNSRIIYEDKEKGMIAASGEEYLVFSSSALSLDRAIINYQITTTSSPGKCLMEVERIRYLYQEKERYTAEEYISDEVTLNKNKTGIYRGYKKFRINTIDFVDKLFEDAARNFGIQRAVVAPVVTTPPPLVTTQAPVVNTQPVVQAAEITPAIPIVTTPVTTQVTIPNVANIPTATQPIATGSAAMAGYKRIAPDKIPGNIIKMLSDDWMLITAGNDQQFNMMTASWGGLGVLYGKPIATCFINPTRFTYQLMEKNDTYTLTFYTEAYRDALKYCGSTSGKNADKVKGSGLTPITTPDGSKAFGEAWLVIECRKLVSQSLMPEAISDQKIKDEWIGKQLHKMFIGEIINIWVK